VRRVDVSGRQVGMAAAGAATFVLGARAARRQAVTARELRVFRAVNALPARAFPPTWVVMQLGSLGGVAAAAGTAIAARRPELGRQLATWGSATWLVAKLAKRPVRRGRPTGTVELARVLGNEQAGLGYPSGHAAVAATLYLVVEPQLTRRWRPVAATAAAGVGMARLYVGAHLPLDVLGGAALGTVVGAVSQLVTGRCLPSLPAQAPTSTPS
jgi:glycosyltransferase 2 family protein